jgi:hypothetical protein
MPNGFYARNFASVIRSLTDRGHKVSIGLEAKSGNNGEKLSAANVILESYLTGNDIKVVEFSKKRRPSLWAATGRQAAALWDYSRYLSRRYARAERCSDRAKSFLLPPFHFPTFLPRPWRDKASRLIGAFCWWIQEILPPRREALEIIRAHKPDIVLLTPLVDLGSDQFDYVKACRRSGIPAGLCVASWDNLTNKGLIKTVPDRVFVWNEAQKAEAVSLHYVPGDRVIVTGAQLFDHWFEMRPTRSRTEFCIDVGLNPEQIILLYTASSVFICRNEVEFVVKWVGALRNSTDQRLRESGVLIRPHPKARKTLSQWEHTDLKKFDNVAIFPKGDRLNLARDGQQDYFNSVHYSSAIIGINTSAMLEGAILGRRSFTIMLDEVRAGQDGMVHFQHLTNGGFLGVANNFEEHIEQLREELDRGYDRTGSFVASFLRPDGIGQPATPIFVDAIEAMEGLEAERLSWCARLGWMQRPFILPLVLLVTLSTSMVAAAGFLRFRGRQLRACVDALRGQSEIVEQVLKALGRARRAGIKVGE